MILAALKFFLFALLCLILVPAQLLVLLFTKDKAAYVLPRVFHRLTCAIFGIKWTIHGEISRQAPLIYMSNHISYLDIPLLGSFIQASFVAKSEVEKWPVFGFLSQLQQTAFIKRKRTAIAHAKNSIAGRLSSGIRRLIIFPEGTSTRGRDVRDFKTSLFALAFPEDQAPPLVQPVTIRLTHTNGQPVSEDDSWDLYSWHIDMDTELPVHLWRIAKTKRTHLEVTFHPVLDPNDFEDRKSLAKACHDHVSSPLRIKQE